MKDESIENETSRKGKCIICWVKPYDMVVFPCGHLAFCGDCWIDFSEYCDLNKKKPTRCPLCIKIIENSKKIYPA